MANTGIHIGEILHKGCIVDGHRIVDGDVADFGAVGILGLMIIVDEIIVTLILLFDLCVNSNSVRGIS
jgi:hypothetical protein